MDACDRCGKIARRQFVLLTLLLAGITGACDSGKLLAGTLGDRNPDLAKYDGLYIQQDEGKPGQPAVYKHELSDLFLSTVPSTTSDHHFIFGPEAGKDGDIMIETNAPSPELAEGPWAGRSFNRQEQMWQGLKGNFKVVCAREDMRTCKDDAGVILLDSNPNKNLLPKLGAYEVQPGSINSRPFYKQVDGRDYLSYVTSGIWMIGPLPGVPTGSVLVRDFAGRAEYITGDWLVGTRWGFRLAGSLKIICGGY